MLVDRLTNTRRLQEMTVIAECFRMACATFFSFIYSLFII